MTWLLAQAGGVASGASLAHVHLLVVGYSGQGRCR